VEKACKHDDDVYDDGVVGGDGCLHIAKDTFVYLDGFQSKVFVRDGLVFGDAYAWKRRIRGSTLLVGNEVSLTDLWLLMLEGGNKRL